MASILLPGVRRLNRNWGGKGLSVMIEKYHVQRERGGMIIVRMPQKKKELEIPGPKRVKDILAAAGVRPATVLVTQGKRLLTKDQRVEDGETVDIISVVSGG